MLRLKVVFIFQFNYRKKKIVKEYICCCLLALNLIKSLFLIIARELSKSTQICCHIKLSTLSVFSWFYYIVYPTPLRLPSLFIIFNFPISWSQFVSIIIDIFFSFFFNKQKCISYFRKRDMHARTLYAVDRSRLRDSLYFKKFRRNFYVLFIRIK